MSFKLLLSLAFVVAFLATRVHLQATVSGCLTCTGSSTTYAAYATSCPTASCTSPNNAYCQITFASGTISSAGCAQSCSVSSTQSCCSSAANCNTLTTTAAPTSSTAMVTSTSASKSGSSPIGVYSVQLLTSVLLISGLVKFWLH